MTAPITAGPVTTLGSPRRVLAASWTITTYVSQDWVYTASEPCCSSCTNVGGNIVVYHWPALAPTPAISLLVDTRNNFTL